MLFYIRLRAIPALLLLWIAIPVSGWVAAQSIDDYHEFHLSLSLDAQDRIVFCGEVTDPLAQAASIGVARNSHGDITHLTLFFFGNIDTRVPWSTMRISHRLIDSTIGHVELRSFHTSTGMPVSFGKTQTIALLYNEQGQLVSRELFDIDGNAVDDTARVHRSIYLSSDGREFLQQWYISTGKMQYGTGSDSPLGPFAALPPETFFRRFTVDSVGNLLLEQPLGFDKKPLPYPGGEYMHAYESHVCGHPGKSINLDAEGHPMADSAGVASTTYIYDNAGRTIEWRTFGVDSTPNARADGVAAEIYHYDKFDGRLRSVERFNERGETIVRAE